MIDMKKEEKTLDNGATETTENVGISVGDIRKYFEQFDSPQHAMIHSIEVAHSFSKDVKTLIESMLNLFQDNTVPLTLVDTELNLTLTVGGELIFQTRLGDKKSSNKIMRFVMEAIAANLKESAQ